MNNKEDKKVVDAKLENESKKPLEAFENQEIEGENVKGGIRVILDTDNEGNSTPDGGS